MKAFNERNSVSNNRTELRRMMEEYHEQKKAALSYLCDSLQENMDEELTIGEAARLTGLSHGEVQSQVVTKHGEAGWEVGVEEKISVYRKTVSRTYAEVTPDGEINMDNQITVTKRMTVLSGRRIPTRRW